MEKRIKRRSVSNFQIRLNFKLKHYIEEFIGVILYCITISHYAIRRNNTTHCKYCDLVRVLLVFSEEIIELIRILFLCGWRED